MTTSYNYIAGKETTTIEKKFDFVAFFVCFPVVTYLAPQISSYQIDKISITFVFDC